MSDALHVLGEKMGFSPMHLSTMTFTGILSLGKIPLSIVPTLPGFTAEKPQKPTIRKRKRRRKEGQKDDEEEEEKPKREFNNQASVYYDTKSVKIFVNGSIQVSGCKSPLEFIETISTLCTSLACAMELDVEPTLTEFKIAMINVNFRVNASVCLPKLKIELDRKGTLVDFQPEKHPAMKLRLPLILEDGTKPNPRARNKAMRVTVLVFESGSIQICGARSPAHVQMAYTHIAETVAGMRMENANDAPKKNIAPQESEYRTFELFKGYPIMAMMLYAAAIDS